jgi:DNA-binding Lrp family transcriptional regulator
VLRSPQELELDDTDRGILAQLQEDADISNTELARRMNLSQATALTRVRRLEQTGYIRRYVALLDREKLGYGMLCYIHVSHRLHQRDELDELRNAVGAMPEVLECVFVTGEFDLILKVALRDQRDLGQFILAKLTPLRGVARVNTSLVIDEIKMTTSVPIAGR